LPRRQFLIQWRRCEFWSSVGADANMPWCGNWPLRRTPARSGALRATPGCIPVGAEDLPRLLALAIEKKAEFTVVGPDNPLALGIVDRFQEAGLRIWGPNQRAARFEASKAFSQAFMQRHNIPTARSETFSEPAAAKTFAASLQGRCAVKADGLALGKGVLICHDLEQADRAIDEMLVQKAFGNASTTIVIQELLSGMEISLHALCDGRTAKLFPTSQDHKRALDGDQGLNTGGMGAYSPTPFLNERALDSARAKILDPWLQGCAAEQIDFCGILYPGIMLTAEGPKVLEFNARFGDPETQVYLSRLNNDLVELLEANVERRLTQVDLEWNHGVAVCVVMAAGGYPGHYAKGKPIAGLEAAGALPRVKVFHAGTALSGDRIVSNGGRVLGVTGWGDTMAAARATAYEAVERIQFEGAFYRRDIGGRAV
jgi:phosphoribosylamine---glycine ligase